MRLIMRIARRPQLKFRSRRARFCRCSLDKNIIMKRRKDTRGAPRTVFRPTATAPRSKGVNLLGVADVGKQVVTAGFHLLYLDSGRVFTVDTRMCRRIEISGDIARPEDLRFLSYLDFRYIKLVVPSYRTCDA